MINQSIDQSINHNF